MGIRGCDVDEIWREEEGLWMKGDGDNIPRWQQAVTKPSLAPPSPPRFRTPPIPR